MSFQQTEPLPDLGRPTGPSDRARRTAAAQVRVASALLRGRYGAEVAVAAQLALECGQAMRDCLQKKAGLFLMGRLESMSHESMGLELLGFHYGRIYI